MQELDFDYLLDGDDTVPSYESKEVELPEEIVSNETGIETEFNEDEENI